MTERREFLKISEVAEIPVGLGRGHVSFDAEDRFAYVANTLSDDVTAVLEVGGASVHIALDPAGECAFVGCERLDEVGIIDLRRQTVIHPVRVGASLNGGSC